MKGVTETRQALDGKQMLDLSNGPQAPGTGTPAATEPLVTSRAVA